MPKRLLDAHVHSLVINMEHAAFDQGLAQTLADNLGGPCYTITELKAENLYMAVRQEMRQVNSAIQLDLSVKNRVSWYIIGGWSGPQA